MKSPMRLDRRKRPAEKPSLDDLIGLPNVARRLGVARGTALLAAARGRFSTIEIDGRMFAVASDVERYRVELEERRGRLRANAAIRGGGQTDALSASMPT